jgi:GNAT superfamily N-acetyltransferase
MLQIRPYRRCEEDYATLARIISAFDERQLTTPESIRHRIESMPVGTYHEAFIASQYGDELGVAFCMDPFWIEEPSKMLIHSCVHPSRFASSFEADLFEYVLEHARAKEVRRIHSVGASDRPSYVQYLLNSGFVQRMLVPITELQLASFDPSRFAAQIENVLGQGIEIVSLSTLMDRGGDWKRSLLDLTNRILQDIPFHAEIREWPMDEFEQHLSRPHFDPSSSFIALDRGSIVGLSELHQNPVNPKRIATGLTGVDRVYRRRGIATALKAFALTWAKVNGGEVVGTENEENNPMLQLNLDLGFRHVHDEMFFVLDVDV